MAALLAALALPLSGGVAHAQEPPALSSQAALVERVLFLEAERALRGGKRERFERLSQRLQGHPLYAWLEYVRLRRGFNRRPESEIEAFLALAPDSHMADDMRRFWIERLAREQRWERLLEVYPKVSPERPDRMPARYRCHRARALLETGRDEAGFEVAADLWLTPRSQDDACDPVFRLWAAKGGRMEEHLWARLELALRHGNRGLANHVSRQLEGPAREIATDWLRNLGANARLVSRIERIGDNPGWERPARVTIDRMARRDPAAAERLWRSATKEHDVPAALAADVAWHIGLGFALDYRVAEAVYWIEQVPREHRHPRLIGFRALLAIAGERWEDAVDALEELPPEERSALRWRYWRAHALDALGRDTEAASLWEGLALERDYYGFLAADRVGESYRFRAQPFDIAPEKLAAFERGNAFRRLYEFRVLGPRGRFQREWRALMHHLDNEGRLMATELAHRHGWHRQAIEGAARARAFDRIELRFPLAWRELAHTNAARHELDPAWVLAIMRVESAFLPQARSPVGARGLMQIMPATGRATARAAGLRYAGPDSLLDPQTNIRLGTAYMHQLLNQLHGHAALASAAYNAGPHRVRQWLDEAGEMTPELWVELIPFNETRRYVKRVLEYRIVYQHLLRQPSGNRLYRDLLAPLPPG